VPLAGLSDADLTAWNATLTQEIAALDRQIAAGPSAAPDTAAGLDAVARAIDPSLAPLVSQLNAARPSAVDPNLGRPADAQQVDERRREIDQLLDAVAARTNGALNARAADLKKRLADVKADTQAVVPATDAIADRVNAVEAALRAVESAASESMAADVRGLEDAIRQQMAGGLDPAAAATARAQLVTMLDSLGARSTPALRVRISELRAAVVPLFEGVRDDLRGRRDQKARLLERIALERTLRREGGPILVDAKTNAERTSATREIRVIQAQIAALDRESAATVDVNQADGARALQALFAACGPCHQANQDKTALRPVVAGRPRLTSATFTHKTHQQQACEACHSTIATSKSGTDVNLPGVVSCQSCHNASQARADCVSCHQYHPRSAAELVVASR
jgi:hypothetical protein